MKRTIIDFFIGGWEGFREFVVSEKVDEAFYLKPADGNAMSLPIYKSGQYISLRFRKGVISGTEHDIIRSLTLSSDESATFKIIVKKGAGHDSGLVSYHMHDNVKVGDILEVSAANSK